MSSSKSAALKATGAKVARKAKAAPARVSRPKVAVPKKPAVVAGTASAPAQAMNLAAEIDQALKDGRLDLLPPEAIQALMASMCKLYSAVVEQGAPYLPVGPRSGVTPTDVMVVASKLLRATNLQVFELGMWQSWTGR
jgi:hypothetical protein